MHKKAVIWDLDGVIVNTIPFHSKAWRHFFHKRAKQVTKEVNLQEIFGQRNDDTLKRYLGSNLSPQEIASLSEEKERYFRRIAKNSIKPMPGVTTLLSLLQEEGFHQALVSSAPMKNITFLLSSMKIKDNFEVVIASEDVKQGKPEPEGFLLAAKKMNVRKRQCVVIEDTLPGIKAAKLAGMKCIAVTGTLEKEKLNDADIIVDNLNEVTVKDFDMLLS